MIEGLKFTIYSPEGKREVKCFDFPCTMGRSMECSVRLKGAGFSRKHLEINVDGDKIVVKNLTETNSSHVNRQLMPSLKDIAYTPGSEIRFSRVKEIYLVIETTTKDENNVVAIDEAKEATNSRFSFTTEDETHTGYSLDNFKNSTSSSFTPSSAPSSPPVDNAPPSFFGSAAPNLHSSSPPVGMGLPQGPGTSPQSDVEYLRLQEEKRKLMEAENEQLREQIVKKVRLEAEEEGWRIRQAGMQEAERIRQQALGEIHQLGDQVRQESSEKLQKIQDEIKNRKEAFNKEVSEHTARMNSEKKNWLDEKDTIRKRIYESEKESKAISENLSKLRLEEDKLSMDVQRAVENFDQQKMMNSHLKDEYEKIQNQIRLDQEKHEKIEKEWEIKLNKQIDDFERRRDEHSHKIENLKIEWAKMEDKLQKLSQVEKEFDGATQRYSLIQEKLSSVEDQLKNQTNAFNEVVKLKKQTEEAIQSENLKITQLQSQGGKFKAAISELQEKKSNLTHFIESERSEALQETYKHKAKVEKDISQLKVLANQKIDEERRRTDEFCIKLKQDAQNEQTKIIADANKQVETIHSARSQEIIKRERILLDNEAKLEEKRKNLKAVIAKREEESMTQASSLLEDAKREIAQNKSRAEAHVAELRVIAERETRALRESVSQELNTQKMNQQKELEEEKQAQKAEIEERKQKLKTEVDSLADKLVEEGNLFKADMEKQFKEKAKSMAKDVADSTAHYMNTVLKDKLGTKANTLELRKYKDEVKQIAFSVITPGEKPSEVQLLLRNARVPASVKKYWLKVLGAMTIGLSITMVFHLNKELWPSIKSKVGAAFGSDNAASDIFVKKIQEARRNRPKFNPQKTKQFKYGYLDNILYTEGYLELISNKDYYQSWVDKLNKLLIDEMKLSDQAVVNIVTAESNMHLKLINASAGVRLDHLEKDLAAATEIEREFLEKIQPYSKNPAFLNFKLGFTYVK